MARPVTIQDEDLLKAAREVFLERGMRATSLEIAERAGVSPGILFKRFKTKEALFRAAMTPRGDPEHLLPIDLDARVGTGSVEDTLVELGTHLLEQFSSFTPTTMMAWSHRQDSEPAGPGSPQPVASATERAVKRVRKVADYLAAEARLGRIRDGDFDVVAQTFIGALWHHNFLQVMLDKRKQPAAQQTYVRGVVQALWVGLAPARPARR